MVAEKGLQMDVVFGLWAYGGASPDHGGEGRGALGQPVVGPAGLIDILETSWGLGGPRSAQVVRIASFQATLEGLYGDFFWSRSLAMDPWATARTLLGWRDELIGLGWLAEMPWTAGRLADLSKASVAATDLPPGLSDRIAAVLAASSSVVAPPLASIRLVDGVELLPSPLRRIVERLRTLGCVVENVPTSPAAPSGTSLGQLQRWMCDGTVPASGADGTVTIATSASEPLAAEILGQWFAGTDAGDVALVAQDGDTDLLDHGLIRAGQPRAGRSRPSIHRGSLQLLLLAFKGSWAPFDPQALMELLIFPGSPVAPRAAGRLASVLEQAPGRGGADWTEAWEIIGEAERQRSDGNAGELARVATRLERWRAWSEPDLADGDAGMPVAQALGICDRVTTWAVRRFAATNDPLYASTSILAGEVRTALASLGRDRLPRLLIERVIDQALDLGHPNPASQAEAARWRSVPHPGAVWAPRDAVVWWNFVTTREGSARSPWTEAERQELLTAGCPADDVTIAARAASAAWERAVLNARERILFVSGGHGCASDDGIHPMAHRLRPALDRVATTVSIETALREPEFALGGTTIGRRAIASRALPEARFAWTVPAGFASRLSEVTESASSLENLFSCQLMWALQHVGRVRPGRVRSIPDANRLLGNLAHAIAREVFVPGHPPVPAEAERRTTELLEKSIDQIAAPLRHPEFAEELNFARRRLPAAMSALAGCLVENGLTVEATEQQVSGTFETLLAMRGAVDLVARDPAGDAVIIDLKWTRSDRSRVEEVSSGRAVQLATYGAMVSGDRPYRAGYFLLNQRQFLTLAGNGLVGRQIEGARTFPETWAAIVEGWRTWRTGAAGGTILATGVEGVEDRTPAELGIKRDVHCERCDYATLCRVRGLA
ncbi:PD-(D/E)XK nuclease superfamily protein [Sphingomonas sp. PP-F2F-A104-K0414]|uniref:PD-(D/E)XK nuclease family protein n=1 Tax=Sphingomonas sp. PP-F2F-A104-K0414 TaxID=2135661 RepID=UPI001051FF6A|nr:PD-(D/E)XK nuclease family protein [Sphingomonas sp. PP-F2F-A104-K0414]TCP96430.1 PD-(D/E)XK nuclease superfamily protein [Sphingomonas sp. PP-F2F-A104-K0414]